MTKKILEKLDDASIFWLLRTVVAKDIVMSSNKRKNFSWWKYCKFVVSVDNTIYPVYWAHTKYKTIKALCDIIGVSVWYVEKATFSEYKKAVSSKDLYTI